MSRNLSTSQQRCEFETAGDLWRRQQEANKKTRLNEQKVRETEMHVLTEQFIHKVCTDKMDAEINKLLNMADVTHLVHSPRWEHKHKTCEEEGRHLAAKYKELLSGKELEWAPYPLHKEDDPKALDKLIAMLTKDVEEAEEKSPPKLTRDELSIQTEFSPEVYFKPSLYKSPVPPSHWVTESAAAAAGRSPSRAAMIPALVSGDIAPDIKVPGKDGSMVHLPMYCTAPGCEGSRTCCCTGPWVD